MATLQDLINYQNTILAQTNASFVAGLPDGSGEIGPNQLGYTVLPVTQVAFWATEGQNRLARLCMPIQDSATFTVATAGQTVLAPYGQIISTDGRVLAVPTGVQIGATKLNPGNQGYLNMSKWFPPDPNNGNATGWATNNTSITLSNNSTAPEYTISGYFLPLALVNVGDPVDPFIDDYSQRTIAHYMAWMVAQKNMDNTVLAERIAYLGGEWTSGVKEIYARLMQNDPTLSAIFAPEPITAMVNLVKQASPKT